MSERDNENKVKPISTKVNRVNENKSKIFLVSIWLVSINFPTFTLTFAKNMVKTAKKTTNKAKFSLYLDKDLMSKIGKAADKEERSVNYKVEKALAKEFNFNLV